MIIGLVFYLKYTDELSYMMIVHMYGMRCFGVKIVIFLGCYYVYLLLWD